MSISVGSVSVDIVPDATKFRREMNAKLKDLTASVRVTLNDKAFEAEIAAATRDRVVNVKVDDKGSIKQMQGRSHALLTTLTLLAPAAAPLTAVALGGAVALTGLGAAGYLAFKGIGAEMQANTPIGLKYAGMIEGLQSDLTGLERVAAKGVLTGVTGAVSAVSASMPELRHEVRLLSESLGSDLEPITRGLLGLFQDLFPTTQTIAGGIHTLAVDFENWANGPGGKSFAAYLAKELPIVASTLASIGTAGAHVVQALLPLGGPVLKGIQGISTVISHIPVEVIESLFLAFAGYKTITLTAAAIDAVTAATKRLGVAQAASGIGGIGGIGGGGKHRAGSAGSTGIGAGSAIPLLGTALAIGTNAAVSLTQKQDAAETNKLANNPAAFKAAQAKLADLQSTVDSSKGSGLGRAGGIADNAAIARIKVLKTELDAAASANKGLGLSADGTTASINTQAAATAAETKVTIDWATAMDNAYTKSASVKSAQIGAAQAIADATAALKTNGRTLDLHTQKGRNNATALLAVATAEHTKIDADITGQKTQAAINRDWSAGHQELETLARKFGLSRTAAKRYADSLLGIKPIVKTTVVINTAAAQAKVDALKNGLSAIQFYANQKDNGPTAPGTGGSGPHRGPGGYRGGYMWGGAFHRSVGGSVWGAGTATSDSVRAYLSNGEFVVKAATVKAVGVPFLNQLNASGAAPAQAATLPPIYVQNPFTGEYLLAQVDARTSAAMSREGRWMNAGRR